MFKNLVNTNSKPFAVAVVVTHVVIAVAAGIVAVQVAKNLSK